MSPPRPLLRDRAAVAFGALFLLLALAFSAAPLYASAVAHTTFFESRVSEQIVLDGEPTFIVSLLGVPIGPTWEGSYFLGADEIGRDLMVRLLYDGARGLSEKRVLRRHVLRNGLIPPVNLWGSTSPTSSAASPSTYLTIVDLVIAWLDPRIRRARTFV